MNNEIPWKLTHVAQVAIAGCSGNFLTRFKGAIRLLKNPFWRRTKANFTEACSKKGFYLNSGKVSHLALMLQYLRVFSTRLHFIQLCLTVNCENYFLLWQCFKAKKIDWSNLESNPWGVHGNLGPLAWGNGSQLSNPDISGAIFTLSLSIPILNSQRVEGARVHKLTPIIWF